MPGGTGRAGTTTAGCADPVTASHGGTLCSEEKARPHRPSAATCATTASGSTPPSSTPQSPTTSAETSACPRLRMDQINLCRRIGTTAQCGWRTRSTFTAPPGRSVSAVCSTHHVEPCGVSKPSYVVDLRSNCRGFLLVDEAAEDWLARYRRVARLCDRPVPSWWRELQCLVKSAVVVVSRVAVQRCSQVVFVDDEQSVGDVTRRGRSRRPTCSRPAHTGTLARRCRCRAGARAVPAVA